MIEIDQTWAENVLEFVVARAAQFVLLLIVWFGFPLVQRAARRVVRNRLNPLTDGRDYEYLVATVLRYTKYFLVTLIILSIFGLDRVVGAALASVGFTALALGFAAQTIMANMFAGLFIMIDANIRIGDRIKIGEVEGTIQEIQIRTTQVLMDSGTLAIVPNKKLVDEIVLENRTHRAPPPTIDAQEAADPHPQLG